MRLDLQGILCTFLILSACGISFAQDSSIQPYFGISLNIDGTYTFANGYYPGWGLEAGIKTSNFYLGLEYGVYAYEESKRGINLIPVTGNFAPYPKSTESYWGIHVGTPLSRIFSLGAVALVSYQAWISPEGEYDRVWFNVGPDIRFRATD